MPRSKVTRTRHSTIATLTVLLVCAAALLPAWGQETAAPLIPVSRAKDGMPADLTYRLRQGFTFPNVYKTGDNNLYYFLHWEEYMTHNIIRRSGAVRQLAAAPNKTLGQIRAHSSLGEMTLDELMANPKSRIQAFIVVQRGKILYQRYPGMREDDHHLWFSSSKSMGSLLVGLLEAEGKIDVKKPIDAYLPELAGTNWQGVRIIDIMDMASGLDLVESEQSRNDPASSVNHFFRMDIGDTTNLGTLTSNQILFTVKKKGPPGQTFEYSTLNTQMLGLLAERVSGKRLADLISERVWSKMGAEGDAMIGVNPQGGAGIGGMISSRLRDKARYGMLYTPSWKIVAAARVIPQSVIENIQKGCRPSIFANSATGRRAADPNTDKPRCNSRQWDAVWADGDMFKGGARGQGIYVSPARDVVVAFFSTTSENGWVNYARAAAKALVPNP